MASRVLVARRLRWAAIIFALVSTTTLCRAENTCPWLNEATASGFLDGDSVGEFTAGTGDQPSECVFTQKDATAVRTLRIHVQVTPDFAKVYQDTSHACGTDAETLRAIGNEAVLCTADDRKGALGERVVGRVRDQVFTITIATTLKGDIHLTRMMLVSKISLAAEQVAGNLF